MKDYINDTDKLDALKVYASNGVRPVEEPIEPNYSDGAAPLSTLPAKWWNYFMNKFTDNVARANRNFADLYAELRAVLTQAGMTPDEATVGQLQAAIANQLDDVKDYADGIVATETTAREEAIAQEVTDRDTAIANLLSGNSVITGT